MPHAVNHLITRRIGVRAGTACVVAWLAVLAPPAQAAAARAPGDATWDATQGANSAEARIAAARSLFRPENAVSRGAPQPLVGDPAGLDRQRGGSAGHNTMQLDGAVDRNSAVNVVSGANSIDAGSFANMAGIPVVIQNSGANVLIQNATIINLQFK